MSKYTIMGVFALVPALAVALYIPLGSPSLPALPAASRLEHALDRQDWPAVAARMEAHLAQNPKDLKGWRLLAPLYERLGESDKADWAYGQILAQTPNWAEGWVQHGLRALIQSGGQLTPEARHRFSRALALAKAQTPPPSWQGKVEALLKTPTIQASPEIAAMVEGLEERLKTTPQDLEGWIRLLRARMVLGQREKAQALLERARTYFTGEDRARLERMAQDLGVSEGTP